MFHEYNTHAFIAYVLYFYFASHSRQQYIRIRYYYIWAHVQFCACVVSVCAARVQPIRWTDSCSCNAYIVTISHGKKGEAYVLLQLPITKQPVSIWIRNRCRARWIDYHSTWPSVQHKLLSHFQKLKLKRWKYLFSVSGWCFAVIDWDWLMLVFQERKV